MKLAQTEPFRTALKKEPLWSVRRSQIIAAALLTNCISRKLPPPKVAGLWSYELAFGDFSPGVMPLSCRTWSSSRAILHARAARKDVQCS